MSIESRLDRIERQLGMDDDEMVELDFGGEIIFMTEREFAELLREIEGSRVLPRTKPYETERSA
jgi:hypothetical protein